jgi:hypothetical protein
LITVMAWTVSVWWACGLYSSSEKHILSEDRWDSSHRGVWCDFYSPVFRYCTNLTAKSTLCDRAYVVWCEPRRKIVGVSGNQGFVKMLGRQKLEKVVVVVLVIPIREKAILSR